MSTRKPLLDQLYWEFVEQIAKEVDSWPEWLQGSKASVHNSIAKKAAPKRRSASKRKTIAPRGRRTSAA
jgi:hypothetical protein